MRWPWIALFALALAGCGEQHPGPLLIGPEVDAVQARHMAYGEALKRRDAAAVSDFCNVCLVMEPRYDAHGVFIKADTGNKALLEDAGGSIVFGTMAAEVSGDLAVSYGECTVTRTNPATRQPVARRGFCLATWGRREDGVWRIRWESRNVAPPDYHE